MTMPSPNDWSEHKEWVLRTVGHGFEWRTIHAAVHEDLERRLAELQTRVLIVFWMAFSLCGALLTFLLALLLSYTTKHW